MDYPTRKLQVNGLQMNVLIAGEGPPVLLVHGFPDTHEVWRKQIPMLVEAVESKSGVLIGRSFRDAPDVDGTMFARCPDGDAEPGDIVNVRITVAKPYDLHGEVVRATVGACG